MGRVRAVGKGGPSNPWPKKVIAPQPIPPAVSTRRTRTVPRELLIPSSAAGQTRRVHCGKFVHGLQVLYAKSFGGNTLYIVAAIGEGPIQSVQPKLDNVNMVFVGPHWRGASTTLQRCWVYLGGQSAFQETASGLFALDPTWITDGSDGTHGYDFLAFAVFKFQFDPEVSSTLPAITFTGEGYADILDTRTATRGYLTNPALFIREVMSNERWGFRLDTDLYFDDSWDEAADDCDVAIFPAAPTAAPTTALDGAGNITGASLTWRYTRVNANGVETLPSPPSTPALAPSSNKVDVTIPAGDAKTASHNVYRQSGTAIRKVGNLAGQAGGVFEDNMSSGTWTTQANAPTVAPLNNKRFYLNLTCDAQASGLDWIQTLRAYCLGVLRFINGKFSFIVNKPLPGGYTPQKFSEERGWGGNDEPANVAPDSIRWRRGRRSQIPNEVEIRYTDINNGFTTTSVVIQRPSVISGAELPRRATFDLSGVGDSALAGRLGTNILNLLWDDATFDWQADRSALATAVWDVIELTGAGLVGQEVRVQNIESEGEGFILNGSNYSTPSYSDEVVADFAPLSTGTNGVDVLPTDPPPAPLSPGSVSILTIGDGFAQVLPSSIQVDWTPPPDWPYTLHFRVTKQSDIGDEIIVHAAVAAGPVEVELDLLSSWIIRVYAIIVITGAISAPLLGTVEPSTDFIFPTAEWPIAGNGAESVGVNGSLIGFVGVDDHPVVRFSPPRFRTRDVYGAASWSQVGIDSFVAANVNNGDVSASAGLIVDGDKLRLHLASPKDIREVRIKYADIAPTSPHGLSGAFIGISNIKYSDDGGATWLPSGAFGGFMGEARFQDYSGDPDTVNETHLNVGNVAGSTAHADWEFTLSVNGTETPMDLRELQVYEWGLVNRFTSHYVLYDLVPDGGPVVIGTFTGVGDYFTNPIDVRNYVHPSTDLGALWKVAIRVVAVDLFGNESEPIDDFASWDIGFSPLASLDGAEQFSNKLFDSTNEAVTQSPADNSTKLATTAYADAMGATKQPLDADLTAIAGLTSAADKGIHFTGSGTAATHDLTTFGRSLIDDANAAAARATLGTVIGTDVLPVASPQASNLNVTDANLSLNGARLQMFAVEITNTAGTLQHRILGERVSGSASAYAGKITGASVTLANTPSVGAGTGFTSGAGIDAAGTSRLIFDTAAQTDSKYAAFAAVEINTTATAGLIVSGRNISSDVNGVTRNRFCLQLLTSAGASHGITTANIASGTTIRIRVFVYLE